MRLGIVWFVLLVFAESWSIIQVADDIGAVATLILLVAGFIFGVQLMRSQGINALLQHAQQTQSMRSPLAPLAVAMVKVIAGILLIIPGFISDILAVIVLLPFVQNGFAAYLTKKSRFQGFAASNFGSSGFNNMFGAGGFAKDVGSGNIYEHRRYGRRAGDQPPVGHLLDVKPEQKN